MTRAVLLRLAAAAATVLSLWASAVYVAGEPKPARAPLKPPVVRPSPTPIAIAPQPSPTGRIQLAPAVRATDLPAVTVTHIS